MLKNKFKSSTILAVHQKSMIILWIWKKKFNNNIFQIGSRYSKSR